MSLGTISIRETMGPDGRRENSLRVNNREILRFGWRQDDDVEDCLRRAADALLQKTLDTIMPLLDSRPREKGEEGK